MHTMSPAAAAYYRMMSGHTVLFLTSCHYHSCCLLQVHETHVSAAQAQELEARADHAMRVERCMLLPYINADNNNDGWEQEEMDDELDGYDDDFGWGWEAGWEGGSDSDEGVYDPGMMWEMFGPDFW